MAEPSEPSTPARPPLSRERILEAALRLADEEGIEALSMRRLAQGLGVQAMSLYNHVSDKDDILDALVELVVGEIELPPLAQDWRASMRHRSTSAHEALLRHPWAALLIMSRVNAGPAMLRYVDATIGCLRRAGFSPVMADDAWNAIDNHVYGFTLQALNFPFDQSEYAAAAAGFLPQLPVETYPHLHELAQLVISGEHDGVSDFRFGLDLILDGLDRILRQG